MKFDLAGKVGNAKISVICWMQDELADCDKSTLESVSGTILGTGLWLMPGNSMQKRHDVILYQIREVLKNQAVKDIKMYQARINIHAAQRVQRLSESSIFV